MSENDRESVEICGDCGGAFEPIAERGFRFGGSGALCYACALRRGGTYDEAHDRWVVEPGIGGLGSAYD